MDQYVLGFAFDDFSQHVLLLRKNRPSWQAGLLNGVGGRVQSGEKWHDAMVREAQEEAGLLRPQWHHYAVLRDVRHRYVVRCYTCVVTGLASVVETKTDELVEVWPLCELGKVPLVAAAAYLIPMALHRDLHGVVELNYTT